MSEALLFGKDGENMLCTEIVLNVKNNFCTQHVLPVFCKKKSFWQRFICMASSTFPSHFCQFGVVKGAADLGGRERRFWIFFCQNRLIQVWKYWKSMLNHRTHPQLFSPYHLKVDFYIQLLSSKPSGKYIVVPNFCFLS